MVRILIALLTTSLSSLKSRQALAVENLVLRQQLAVYDRRVKRPKLNKADRAFWLVLMQLWPKWREALVIVKPETVIAWHRKGFRLFWAWRSRRLRRVRDLIEGRPKVARVVHFNATSNPAMRYLPSSWTAEQMIEAFPEDTAPRYVIRDRDSIYRRHAPSRRVAPPVRPSGRLTDSNPQHGSWNIGR